jgi:hypothetical protein
MGDVVNLRLARKRKARADKASEAETARLLHGRSKAERQRDALLKDRTVAFLDGHRRDDPDADGGD